MNYEVPIRINVIRPPAGIVMQVQKGRDELVPPTETGEESISFDFSVTVDLLEESPNFLGKFAQGAKQARFIYVNSGKQAGQKNTCWDRRAKITLMPITVDQIMAVIASPDARLETSINGVGRDGGPVHASPRPPPVWKVVKR